MGTKNGLKKMWSSSSTLGIITLVLCWKTVVCWRPSRWPKSCLTTKCSDCAWHVWNRCDNYKAAKVVQRNLSENYVTTEMHYHLHYQSSTSNDPVPFPSVTHTHTSLSLSLSLSFFFSSNIFFKNWSNKITAHMVVDMTIADIVSSTYADLNSKTLAIII